MRDMMSGESRRLDLEKLSARWNVAATKPLGLKKPIVLREIEEAFRNVKITGLFSMTASDIAMEARTAPSPETIARR
jgi:hypothetical protein